MFKSKISRLLHLSIFICLVTVFHPMPGQAQPSIFAGEGMGKIHIGEARASVLGKLGKPTKSFRWDTMGVLQDTWTSKKSGSRLVVLYPTQSNQVVQVETTSPKFYSPSGLSLQSTAPEASAYLGQGKGGLFLKSTASSNPQYYLLMYHAQKGIGFFFNVTLQTKPYGKCEKIVVFTNPLPVPVFSTAVYKPISYNQYMAYKQKG